jgi:hypothetical protein
MFDFSLRALRALRLGERSNFAFDPFHFVPFVCFVVQTMIAGAVPADLPFIAPALWIKW